MFRVLQSIVRLSRSGFAEHSEADMLRVLQSTVRLSCSGSCRNSEAIKLACSILYNGILPSCDSTCRRQRPAGQCLAVQFTNAMLYCRLLYQWVLLLH